MPRASAASSSPPVHTRWPFLPMTIAVPVSWQEGSTMPAEMLAFFSMLRATKRSFGDASGSSKMRAQLRQMAGPEEMRDVAHGRGGEARQRSGVDGQNRLAAEGVGGDEVAVEAAVRRRVRAVREHLLEAKLGHRCISPQSRGEAQLHPEK